MKAVEIIQEVFDQRDGKDGPLLWFKISERLAQYFRSDDLSSEETAEVEAELYAFRAIEVPEQRRTSSLYSFPEFVWSSHESAVPPPIVDTKVFDHWRRRLLVETQPVLRARYADLIWDLERFALQKSGSRDYQVGSLAIDSYVEAAREGTELSQSNTQAA